MADAMDATTADAMDATMADATDATIDDATDPRGDDTTDLRRVLTTQPRLILPSQLRVATNAIIRQATRENTLKAYDPKREEFLQFCDFQYQATALERGRYTVTSEKVEVFMHYQCYRNKQPSLGSQRNSLPARFRPEEFNSILERYGNVGTDAVIEDPDNGLGHSCIVQYKAAIKRLWEEQVQELVNGVHNWEFIWGKPLNDMLKMVKERKRRISKKNYVEKMDHETSHYGSTNAIERIEEAFFCEGLGANSRQTFASLRNRFVFLMTTQGILRGESVFKAELSDFFGVPMQRDGVDPHPLYVVVCQIATGKTNKDLKLYGRVARHKDPCLCSVGALAFYLLYRFSCTGEFDDHYDFTENGLWFDIKLLVDLQTGYRHGFTESIKQKPYAEAIKRICHTLGIPSAHAVHIGRILGCFDSEEKVRLLSQLQGWSHWGTNWRMMASRLA
jgi:hypothetical protein